MKSESMLFFKMVQDFLTSYLPEQKGASHHTIRSYKATLNGFLNYACGELGVKLQDFHFGIMGREIVEKYLLSLEADKGYATGSRNNGLAALKSFCKFSALRDAALIYRYQEIALIPLKKETDKPIEIFSEGALKAILEAPNTSKRNGLRDRMFMMLLYDTAARLQEIIGLRISDINLGGANGLAKNHISVIGKGQKHRYIPIMQKTAEHLAQYIKAFHGDSKDGYLFYVQHRGLREKLSQDAVEKFIRKYGERAKESCNEVPEKVYPHMFRHSRATHLYRSGMQLALISEWLGHSQMKTTMKYYASANTEMKEQAISKATSNLNPIIRSCVEFDVEYDDDLIRRLYGLA